MDPFIEGSLAWAIGLIIAASVAIAAGAAAWAASRRGASQLVLAAWVSLCVAAGVYLVMVLSIQSVA